MSSAPAVAANRNQNLSSAVREAEERYIAANPESQRLAQLASQRLPGGNTRTTVHFSPFPLYMATGKGSRLIDVDGHSYADFINEYTAGVFGHSNAVIGEAVRQALGGGINLGAPTRHERLLAEEIQRRFPAMELLRFCNSGTEANLLALATACAVTGKPGVMIFDGAYHGSIVYFAHGASPLNMQFDWISSTFNDLERMQTDIAANADRLAAVIVEPMQGGAGALPADPAFLQGVRAACDANEVLLVLDEVMTSRLDSGGLQSIMGVKPDLMTLGKCVGGGLTIGAFGGRADIMARFDPSRPDAYPHGGTFNNNVLAMAAGHAALTRVLTADAQARMNALGDRLRTRLAELARKHDVPMQVTGLGSIFGIHFHAGPIRNIGDLDRGERGREALISDIKKLFHLDMLAAGQYISRRVMGNLSVETSEADADALCQAIEEFLVSRGALVRDAFHQA
ncbi:MAG TPA: aminotransferase class III-fold pyridoxal phosphate-dependent enzyme [Dongiaceae bacterium]|jgi:glutamate-1-semialdehyde 2,1-aminomutase